MTEKTNITIHDCLKAAFKALLEGNLEERDRHLKLAQMAMNGEDIVPADREIDSTEGMSRQ